MSKLKFDKTAYAEKSFSEADKTVAYWKTRPMEERLQAGYHLSLRAYGYDPYGPEQKIDRTIFSIRYNTSKK